jgi:hypothetical protein
VLADGSPLFYAGEPVVGTKADATEIANGLASGTSIEAFYPESDWYYGCPEHAANGDAWYYAEN